MKRTYYLTIAVLLSLFTGGLTSCVSDDNQLSPDIDNNFVDDKTLVLNYNIDLPNEVVTYAEGSTTPLQEAQECNIFDIYVLFFRPADYSAEPNMQNKYIGYSKTTSVKPKKGRIHEGSTTVTLPGNLTKNEDVQIIALANYENYAYLHGYNSIGEMFDTLFPNQTIDFVNNKLRLYFDDTRGYNLTSYGLPMSSIEVKSPETGKFEVQFKRRVARIDLKNSIDPSISTVSGDESFELTEVYLYNVNNNAYATNIDENIYADTDITPGYTMFEDQRINLAQGSTEVKAKLYAHPNYVMTPLMTDGCTTCLIVKGKYGKENGKEYYYRINVTPNKKLNETDKFKEQRILANGLYTINITKVTGPGDDEIDDALNNNQNGKLEYTVNEWDDSLLGTHTFDEYGNALSVSQHNVTFASKGDQKLTLDVFTKNTDTHPITNDWEVKIEADPVIINGVEHISAEDVKSYFAVEKIQESSTPSKQFVVKTTKDNETTTDMHAKATISWGTITLSVNLLQLSPYSKLTGMTTFPAELWLPNTRTTAKISVNTQGNFKGISVNNIKPTVIYDESHGTGWIEDVKPLDTQQYAEKGIFEFEIQVMKNTIPDNPREARVKFILEDNNHLATAETAIRQSSSGIESLPTDRVKPTMRIDNKLDGNYEEADPSTIVGLPKHIKDLREPMLFAQTPSESVYYDLLITSELAWKIVPNEKARNGLVFSTTSGGGTGSESTTVVVKAARDVTTPWYGSFEIEYENGRSASYAVAQDGVMRKLTDQASSQVYYYAVITLGETYWTDREIGQKVGTYYDGKFINSSSANAASTDLLCSNRSALNIMPSNLNLKCPPGWALPTEEQAAYFLNAMTYNSTYKRFEQKISIDPGAPLSLPVSTAGRMSGGVSIPFENRPANESGFLTTYNIMLPLRNYEQDHKLMCFQCRAPEQQSYKRYEAKLARIGIVNEPNSITVNADDSAMSHSRHQVTYWVWDNVNFADNPARATPLMVRCTRQINNN